MINVWHEIMVNCNIWLIYDLYRDNLWIFYGSYLDIVDIPVENGHRND